MKRHPEAGYDCTTPRRRGVGRPAESTRTPAWSFEADVVQHAFVLAPFGLDAHMEVEEHPGVEKLFQVFAGGDANPLDHLSAPADDNRLLRLALDDDGAIQLEDPAPAFRLLESIDHHRARKGNFGVGQLQQLLADD